MSTRSRIGYKREDGRYETVYCHWDGYPDNNGRLLVNYYNSLEDAKKIVELGDLSSLGTHLNPIGEHSFDKPEVDCTVAYHRDRGEDNVESIISDTKEDLDKIGEEYLYLFENGKWICFSYHSNDYINLYD